MVYTFLQWYKDGTLNMAIHKKSIQMRPESRRSPENIDGFMVQYWVNASLFKQLLVK